MHINGKGKEDLIKEERSEEKEVIWFQPEFHPCVNWRLKVAYQCLMRDTAPGGKAFILQSSFHYRSYL